MAPTLHVSAATKAQAQSLLAKGTGDAAVQAVALLLQDTSAGNNGSNAAGVDAGSLLQQGLTNVTRRPHEALGLAPTASEGEVRRAFRKQALRYHPDKTQGTTTQLFQSLQTASQKALDPKHVPPPPPNRSASSSYTGQSGHAANSSSSSNAASTASASGKYDRFYRRHQGSNYFRGNGQEQNAPEWTSNQRPSEGPGPGNSHSKPAQNWERYKRWQEKEAKEEADRRANRESSFRERRAREVAEEEERVKKRERAREHAREQTRARARAAAEEAEESARKAAQKRDNEEAVFERRRAEEAKAAKRRYAAAQAEEATAARRARAEAEKISVERRRAARAAGAAAREEEVLRRRREEEETRVKERLQRAEAVERQRERETIADGIRKAGEAVYQSERDDLRRKQHGRAGYYEEMGLEGTMRDAGARIDPLSRTSFGEMGGSDAQEAAAAAAAAKKKKQKKKQSTKAGDGADRNGDDVMTPDEFRHGAYSDAHDGSSFSTNQRANSSSQKYKTAPFNEQDFDALRRKAEAFADAAAKHGLQAAFEGLNGVSGASSNGGSAFEGELHESRSTRATRSRQRRYSSSRRHHDATGDDHSPELTPMPDEARNHHVSGGRGGEDDDDDDLFFDIGDNFMASNARQKGMRSAEDATADWAARAMKQNLRHSATTGKGQGSNANARQKSTFTVGADGKVKFNVYGEDGSESDSDGSPTGAAAAAEAVDGEEEDSVGEGGDRGGFGAGFRAGFMLAPGALAASEVGPTTAKLQWDAPPSHSAFELQWRAVGGAGLSKNPRSRLWQSSGARIRARKCLKKNLESGTIYEFRVRTLMPRRSAWSDPTAVQTLDEESKGTTTYEFDGSRGTAGAGRAKTGYASADQHQDFASAWKAVQQKFEAGAPEEVIRGMLEEVADRFVESNPDDAQSVLKEMADAVSQNYRTAHASVEEKANSARKAPWTAGGVPDPDSPLNPHKMAFGHGKTTPDDPNLRRSSDGGHGDDDASSDKPGVRASKAAAAAAAAEARRVAAEVKRVHAKFQGEGGDDGGPYDSRSNTAGDQYRQRETTDSEASSQTNDTGLSSGADSSTSDSSFSDDDEEDEDEDEEERSGAASDRRQQRKKAGNGADVASRIMQLMPPRQPPVDHYGRPTEYKHAVRAEPYGASPLIGYLLCGRDVEVVVSVGEWAKVRTHVGRKHRRRSNRAGAAASGDGAADDGAESGTFGWCLEDMNDGGESARLVDTGKSPPPRPSQSTSAARNEASRVSTKESRRRARKNARKVRLGMRGGKRATQDDDQGDNAVGEGLGRRETTSSGAGHGTNGDPVSSEHEFEADWTSVGAPDGESNGAGLWYERVDENGSTYYYNDTTHESTWDPPDWVQEIDHETGSSYYVHIKPGSSGGANLHSTWRMPKDGALAASESPASEPFNDDVDVGSSAEKNQGSSTASQAKDKKTTVVSSSPKVEPKPPGSSLLARTVSWKGWWKKK